MIYCAYPIDQATKHDALQAVLRLMHDQMHRLEVPGYWPGRAFVQAGGDPAIAANINNAALDMCAGLLGVWLAGLPTFGVPIEIDRARRAGKPVAVITDAYSMQMLSMGVAQFGVDHNGVVQAVEWILEHAVDGGGSEMRWTGDPECAPRRHYTGDAGFDLLVSEDTVLRERDFVDVPLGVSVELPRGVWAILTGRSSTLRKRGILVNTGIIDQGYRGPLFAACQNLEDREEYLRRGERIAQLIPMPLVSATLTARRVPALGDSDRGSNGFGSTGCT